MPRSFLKGGFIKDMEQIQELLKDPLAPVVALLVLFYAAQEVIKNWDWVKGRFDGCVQRAIQKNDEEKKEKEIEKKVDELAATSLQHTQSMERLERSLEELNQTMKEGLKRLEDDRKKDTRASARATLLSLYENLKDKDSLELGEYETFSDIAERYIKAGGNGPFKCKIIPEILNKKQIE